MLKKLFLLSDQAEKNLKKSVVFSTLAVFSQVFPSMAMMLAFWQILQPFFGGTVAWDKLWMIVGLSVFIVAIMFAAHIAEYKSTYIAGSKASSEKRISIAEHMRRLPISFFEKKDLTELAGNILADCTTIEQAFTSLVPSLLGNLFAALLNCIMLCLFDWRMGLAIFITVPISVAVVVLTSNWQKREGVLHNQAQQNMNAQIQEYLEGIKVTKAFCLGGQSFQDLDQACRHMKQMNIRSEAFTGTLFTIAFTVLRFGLPITILSGITFFRAGTLEPVYLFFFLMVASRIYTGLTIPLSKWGEIVYAQVSIDRLRRLYNQPIMTGEKEISLANYNIEFRDVAFEYNPGEPVLEHVSMRIPQGQVTALVGPSGSGKSTVSRLIARFWDVNQGTVSIGGVDVRTIDPETLLSWISYVFQDVMLFNDSIYGNIAMGNEKASREEVLAAAKAANCHEFVSRLEDGYDTIIGENGCTLSGGERQRISIARAILKNAPIVLLDEATASLDPENEVEIQQALTRLAKGKTVVVIAHRLRTISEAENIIVLNEGKVVEQGDHQALMKENGVYANLFTVQQENLGWNLA